jgi:hypothetical protein
VHVIKQWLGLRHADFSSPIRWLSANLRFDGIQGGDTPDHLTGNQRWMRLADE